MNYLDIGDELVVKESLNADRYSVWEKLFPVNYRRPFITIRVRNRTSPVPVEAGSGEVAVATVTLSTEDDD